MANLQPPMAVRGIETPHICDVCGMKRSVGNHKKCSIIRQKINAAKWAEHEQAKRERGVRNGNS